MGGATKHSRFSVDLLKAALEHVDSVKAAGFDGVTFDIERTTGGGLDRVDVLELSLIHLSEPTRPY